MQTGAPVVPQSSTDSTPHSPPSQSLAAQLPIEILDTILQFLQFDYDIDASEAEVRRRDTSLCAYSLVAKRWKGPARRFLFTNITFDDLEDLLLAAEAGIMKRYRKFIKTLSIDLTRDRLSFQEKRDVANAIFRLLSRSPHLTSLALRNVQFDRFDARDSLAFQTFTLLPFLQHVSLHSTCLHLDPILHDLLVTSDHNISRFSYWTGGSISAPHVRGRGLHDFRGKLRELYLDGPSVGRFLDEAVTDLDSLEGLEELRLLSNGASKMEEGENTMEEVFEIIGPTLKTLDLTHNFDNIAPYLPSCTALHSLDLDSDTDADPTPILVKLPPSLRSLNLRSDKKLVPTYDAWQQQPLLAPKLKELAIDEITTYRTIEECHPVDTLSTNFSVMFMSLLGGLFVGRVYSFDHLNVQFLPNEFAEIHTVQRRCRRAGIDLVVRTAD